MPGDTEIVEGMKAITAYLRARGCSIDRTTLWRMERRGEFPVRRRPPAGRRSRAWTTPRELDDWLARSR